MEPNHVEILLVEDNHTDAELTIRALKKYNLGNRLVWVKDGAEALDYLFSRGEYEHRDEIVTPKVLLLDLHLPKVTGLEVLQEIRSHDSTKMIPVVILTSSKEEKDIVESYRLGVNSFISKPVEFDEFIKTISDLGLYWLLLNKLPY
jgi:two-component system, response regulator